MSFSIVLKSNSSPANALTKSATVVATYTGTLKDGTSITDPVVIVENSGVITGVNYASIADFGRDYFIKDIKSVYNNMWEISLHVDVLSTYATQIRACQAIVAKSASSYNLYLNDTNYKCYQNPRYYTRKFPYGFLPENNRLVLALCCGKTQSGS